MAAEARRPRVAEIRDALENGILTGEVPAGERLDEQALADRFGVSRTPVREAVRQLASTGLVELIPNRGAFVRKVSTRELIEMFEVMAGLEAMAGRLATRRASPEQMGRLVAALEACERAAASGDTDAYYAENGVFHAAIYEASGNDFLIAEASRLHQRLMTYRRLQLRVPRRMGHSLAEHRAIVEAITAGDETQAETALREHITIQGERFADLVSILKGRDAAE
ncbi:GntR family transcriptional regulator [Amorphus coralli]|uniref:GntR family transcriptional regulator n=1 Tax=Amorphus coralli TaxID=340680 RepID=UPI00037813D2|nr:GntR family transcriptional regulator [Amorphus coralli]